MLETALAEAEGRAQAERMERLRGVASASVNDDAGTNSGGDNDNNGTHTQQSTKSGSGTQRR